jgi:uncharacterized LabA/DUF88 family protein
LRKELKLSAQKVAIFIDGNNFYDGLKNIIGNVNIDYRKFAKLLVGDKQLTGIYYYNSPVDQTTNPEGYRKQQGSFAYLQCVPRLCLTLGRLEKRKVKLPDELYQRVKDLIPDQPITSYVEKGVDTSLAVDMVMLAYKNMYDVAILVSGVMGILCLWLREFRILVKR